MVSLQVWLPLNGNLNNQGLSNITFSGTPTWKTSGKIGASALNLSSRITFNCPELNGTKYFSVCFWGMTESNPDSTANWMDLFALNDKTANGETAGTFRFETGYGSAAYGGIHWHDNATNAIINGSYIYNTASEFGQWHHICVTVSDTQVCSYYDGVLKQTYTSGLGGGFITGVGWIGETTTRGGIQDIRIYDHALSEKEVELISRGLVLHYPLNRDGFGQDNLYTGSKTFSGTWTNLSYWTTDSELYNNFTVKKKSSVWGGLAQNISCTSGDIFTISFYAKVDSGGNILSIHRSSLGNTTTGLTILGGNFKSGTDWVVTSDNGTQWKYYWATVKIIDSNITYLQWRIENSIADKYLYVCGMKLERGSTPTPWIPAATDPEYILLGLNSNIIYDSSGHQHNGEIINNISYQSDSPRYSVSAHMSATNQKIKISNFPTVGFGNSYSFVWWEKISSVTPMHWGFADGIRLNGMYTGRLWNTGDGSNNPLYTPGTTTQVTAPTTGVWHHWAMVGDGTTCKVYQDGVLWGQAKTYKSISGSTIYINGWDSGTSYCSDNASMSDFRIYCTALTAEQIKELYDTSASLANNGTLLSYEFVEGGA